MRGDAIVNQRTRSRRSSTKTSRRYVDSVRRPLQSFSVVDGEKAVFDCHDHSLVPKTLYDKPSAPRGPLELSDVTRSSVTLSWLAPTSNGGAARAPVTDVDVRRAGQAADVCLHGRQPGRAERLPIPRLRRKRRDLPDRRLSDRFHGRRLTVTVTIRIRPVHSYGPFPTCLQ